MKSVPSFAEQVKELAGKAVSAIATREVKTVQTTDAAAEK